jgi:antitoxin VapB
MRPKINNENTEDPVPEPTRPSEKRAPDADKDNLAERLLEIGRECAAHLKEPYRSIDHGDLLYDEKGLPK